MKKMVIAWVLLVGGLVGVLTYIGFSYEKSVSDYKSLEADMVEAADTYIKINNLNTLGEENLIIKDTELQASNLINMKVDDDECNGYVEIKKNINKTEYKAYISCRDYETEGYKTQK